MKLIWYFAAVAILALTCPAAACISAKYQDKIAYVSFFEDKPQIYSMNFDGSQEKMLTDTSVKVVVLSGRLTVHK